MRGRPKHTRRASPSYSTLKNSYAPLQQAQSSADSAISRSRSPGDKASRLPRSSRGSRARTAKPNRGTDSDIDVLCDTGFLPAPQLNLTTYSTPSRVSESADWDEDLKIGGTLETGPEIVFAPRVKLRPPRFSWSAVSSSPVAAAVPYAMMCSDLFARLYSETSRDAVRCVRKSRSGSVDRVG